MCTLPLNISKKVPKICSKEKKNQSALEILGGEGLKQFWKSRWKRGKSEKLIVSSVGRGSNGGRGRVVWGEHFFWNNSIIVN